MTRHRRISALLIDGLFVLSFLAAVGLLIRSYRIPVNEDFGPSPEGFGLWSPSRLFAADWLHGKLILYHAHILPGPNGAWGFSFGVGDHFWSGNGLDDDPGILGFRAFSTGWRDPDGTQVKVQSVVVPFMAIAAVLLAACVYRLRKAFRARAMRPANECTHCGYDLRASRGRCPECGQPFAHTNPTGAGQ